MSGPLPRTCRTCGAPGSLYLSGAWCKRHTPHKPQPVPPPVALVRRDARARAEAAAADARLRASAAAPGPSAPAQPRTAASAALVARVQGLAAKAPRHVEDPYTRPGHSRTSAAAALKALPKSGTQRRAVLDALVSAYTGGHHGATDPELARHLQLSPNTIRPRRGELVEMGLVESSGRVRAHEGNDHTVWAPTPAALGALHVLPREQA